MAGYGYTYRGNYSTYGGVTSQTEGPSKTSYTSGHVNQPAIIDAEGRRKPIISSTRSGNAEYYVTTEIIEPVPLVTGYKQSTPATVRVEELRDYGDGEGNWNRPSSPVHERPREVEDFITKTQSEASRPNDKRFVPLSATNWHKTPSSYHVNTGYSDQSGLSNKESQRPSGNTFRNDASYDGAWAKPRSTPQKDELSKPGNNVDTAMECYSKLLHLFEATPIPKSSLTPQPFRHSAPVISAGAKRNTYPQTIDNREAARRYGNLKLASPHQGGQLDENH